MRVISEQICTCYVLPRVTVVFSKLRHVQDKENSLFKVSQINVKQVASNGR